MDYDELVDKTGIGEASEIARIEKRYAETAAWSGRLSPTSSTTVRMPSHVISGALFMCPAHRPREHSRFRE